MRDSNLEFRIVDRGPSNFEYAAIISLESGLLRIIIVFFFLNSLVNLDLDLIIMPPPSVVDATLGLTMQMAIVIHDANRVPPL